MEIIKLQEHPIEFIFKRNRYIKNSYQTIVVLDYGTENECRINISDNHFNSMFNIFMKTK